MPVHLQAIHQRAIASNSVMSRIANTEQAEERKQLTSASQHQTTIPIPAC